MIICIDGADFCGKDTLAKALIQRLGQNAIIAPYHRPSVLAEQLSATQKEIPEIKQYLDATEKIVQTIKSLDSICFSNIRTIQYLYLSIVPLFKKVLKILEAQRGLSFQFIILPRSWTSTIVYLMANLEHLTEDQTKHIKKAITSEWGSIIDKYFFITLDRRTLEYRREVRRRIQSEIILRPFKDNTNFLMKVNKGYIDLKETLNSQEAKTGSNKNKCVLIDCKVPVEDAVEIILKEIQSNQKLT